MTPKENKQGLGEEAISNNLTGLNQMIQINKLAQTFSSARISESRKVLIDIYVHGYLHISYLMEEAQKWTPIITICNFISNRFKFDRS